MSIRRKIANLKPVLGSRCVDTLCLVIKRVFLAKSFAERPALLSSSLLFVLGVQIFALALLGELIIFTHAKELNEYTVDDIVN